MDGNSPNLPDLPRPRPEKILDKPALPLPGLPENISLPANITFPEDILETIDGGAYRLRYDFINFTLLVYQVVVVILLLNLLIAAMSSTVQKLQYQKDMNWKFNRTRIRITYFDDAYAVPVPLNIIGLIPWVPYFIFAVTYFLWKGDTKYLMRSVIEGCFSVLILMPISFLQQTDPGA